MKRVLFIILYTFVAWGRLCVYVCVCVCVRFYMCVCAVNIYIAGAALVGRVVSNLVIRLNDWLGSLPSPAINRLARNHKDRFLGKSW